MSRLKSATVVCNLIPQCSENVDISCAIADMSSFAMGIGVNLYLSVSLIGLRENLNMS